MPKIEHARAVLEQKPELREDPYWQAAEKGELPVWYLQELQITQAYSDYCTPGRLVDMWHPEYPFMKCRVKGIMRVHGQIRGLISDSIIPEGEVLGKFSEFFDHEWECEKGAKGEYWTTPEEIKLINKTLGTAINLVATKYGLAKLDESEAKTMLDNRRKKEREERFTKGMALDSY